MFLLRARLLIATLWAGSLWTIGYLVAPTLFATLSDRVLAGTIAASLFRAEAWLSLCCGGLLLVLPRRRVRGEEFRTNKLVPGLVCGMLACTLTSHFGLQPFMAALREAAAGAALSGHAKAQFGILHGLASTIYLIESLLAGALIIAMRARGTVLRESGLTRIFHRSAR